MAIDAPRFMIADDLTLDLIDQRAFMHGTPLSLSPKSFSLLAALMQSPQTLVTKDAIFSAVWPGVIVGDAALTTAIKELRQALNDTVKSQVWIQTVRGKGYRFRQPVTAKADELDRVPGITQATEPAPALSIAVLPFADMSEAGDQEYFSEGISEEILNALVKVPHLRVAGRTSSFAYKKQNMDIRKIGAALNVANVLEGSVRKHGNKVRITAQLIQASDGYHLWSQTYNGALDDVFELQEKIAHKIAAALEAVLGGGANDRLAKVLTDSPEAYDLFLRGRALVAVRAGETTLTQAVKLLEHATRIDPSFAEAWAELARANNTLPQYTLVTNSNTYLDRAAGAAATALKLDPSLSRAHLAASGIDSRRHGLTAPYAHLIKAVELDPRDADAVGALGYYWCIIGHINKAVDIGEAAVKLDPLNATNLWTLAIANINAGQLRRAQDLLEQALGLGFLPAMLVLPHVMALSGDRETARDWLARALMPLDDLFQKATGIEAFGAALATAIHSDDAEARTRLRAALRTYASQPGAVFNAQILGFILYLADFDTFFDTYTANSFSGDTYTLCTLWDAGPVARALRQHDRFPDFTETVGLAAAWREHGDPD